MPLKVQTLGDISGCMLHVHCTVLSCGIQGVIAKVKPKVESAIQLGNGKRTHTP